MSLTKEQVLGTYHVYIAEPLRRLLDDERAIFDDIAAVCDRMFHPAYLPHRHADYQDADPVVVGGFHKEVVKEIPLVVAYAGGFESYDVGYLFAVAEHANTPIISLSKNFRLALMLQGSLSSPSARGPLARWQPRFAFYTLVDNLPNAIPRLEPAMNDRINNNILRYGKHRLHDVALGDVI